MSSFSEVGVYSLGFKLSNVIKIFIVTSIQSALIPIVLKKINDTDNKRFYSKIMTYFTLGVTYLSLILVFFCSEIITLISNDTDYNKASELSSNLITRNSVQYAKGCVNKWPYYFKENKNYRTLSYINIYY